MSEPKQWWCFEASADGARQSAIVFGTKADARVKFCEINYFGTYEEAQGDEFIQSLLEEFDDEENCWADGVLEISLEQAWLRVAKIDECSADNRIKYLEAQLAEANAVAEFYGDRKNWMTPWMSTKCATDTQFMPLDDIENVEMKNKGHWRRIAGKRARQYIQKWKVGK